MQANTAQHKQASRLTFASDEEPGNTFQGERLPSPHSLLLLLLLLLVQAAQYVRQALLVVCCQGACVQE